jgi:hypothetical protein
MRTQQLILRKIAEQNLDPTVAYVSGKNGQLVKRGDDEAQKPKNEDDEKNKDQKSSDPNEETEAPLLGSLATQADTANEKVEEKPKKKAPPQFKKKTTTVE